MKYRWERKKLKEIVQFNPKESLSKGVMAKKIGMDKLKPYVRDISEYELAEFAGGTKFRNRDTIMARITPCLENGKIAKVSILEKDEVGFGSTEYIVFRAIEGVSDEDYIYYLVCSSIVKEPAIKSMVGSSGRQRVQIDVIQNLEIEVPPYDEQVKIASILRDIDDKIELNNKINNNLEQQVSTLYQAWFEDFILSNKVCPDSWKYVTLADIAEVSSGKRPSIKSAIQTNENSVPLVGAASVIGFTNEANHTDKILVIGRVGTHGVVQRFNSPCWASDNTLVITSGYYEYTNQILKRIDYHLINRGSTQPLITQGDMNKVVVLMPDNITLTKFEEIAGIIMNWYETNIIENSKLTMIRDLLLQKLISGEIDVSNINF